MTAIRGAITIDLDCASEIKEKTAQLIQEIISKNQLKIEDIVCFVFTTTDDIHSYYPAKAAREAGYDKTPLFSAQEPKITGALVLCIRLLVLVNKDMKPVPIYLGKAAALRKDITQRINIALDGPAGSGKSTIAKILAKDMNILYLDTGAMYRACALKIFQDTIDYQDENAVNDSINKMEVTVEYKNQTQYTLLNGEDVSDKIRMPDISMIASKISTFPKVREKMVRLQQEIAKKQSCILDGRDIATAVLPDAPYKFYITADSKIRAKRRQEQLKEKGITQDLEKIHQEILERDKQDMTRTYSPLRQAKDAILVDTGNMDVKTTVQWIKNKIQEKV